MAKSSKPAKRRPNQARPRPAPASPGQVGRRPSNPALIMLVGLIWVGCGVYALFSLTASWKLIPAILFVGIGLFFIRGAAATYVRRDEHGQPKT